MRPIVAKLADQATRRSVETDHYASDKMMIQQRVHGSRTELHPTPLNAQPRAPSLAPGVAQTTQPAHTASSPTRRALLATSLAVATMAQPRASAEPGVPTITTVFVAGATGQTGSRVVAELRRRGYTVIAGVRSPAKAIALGFDSDPGIRVVRADVTEGVQVLADAIGDAQAVLCALGYNGGSDPQGFVEVDSKVRSSFHSADGCCAFACTL